MVVSLKANRKRIVAFLILAAVVAAACLFLKSGGEENAAPVEYPGGTNEERLAFLASFGWETEGEPTETREVMIPSEFNDVYTAYNVMQEAQGFELMPYAGETCTQYKYKITNYPDETEIYATLLVRGERIIGGDVASAKLGGFMHGFAKDSARYGETHAATPAPESTAPESAPEAPAPESAPAESDAASASADDGEAPAEETAALPEETVSSASPAEEAYPTD